MATKTNSNNRSTKRILLCSEPRTGSKGLGSLQLRVLRTMLNHQTVRDGRLRQTFGFQAALVRRSLEQLEKRGLLTSDEKGWTVTPIAADAYYAATRKPSRPLRTRPVDHRHGAL